MQPTLPILISLMTAAIGALLLARMLAHMGRSPVTGAAIGAVAGALGPMIFMVPLNYCTFEAERSSLDVGFGVFLIFLGTLGAIWGATELVHLRWGAPRFVNTQGMFKGRLTPWLLLLPTLLILVFFLYYPSIENFRMATLLARLGAPRTAFICVKNFTDLLEPGYYSSVLVTFVIAGGIIMIGLSLSLLIAVMAYQPITGARIYRALLVWPYAVSPAVAGVIFFLMFSTVAGVINHLLDTIFGFTVPWQLDPTAARWTVIIASVWKTMGFNILFYIAGLQNVPSDLQEAAAIDGANAVQRFWTVVIPLLSPITFFLIVTNMTYAFFDIFGTIDILTGGGPSQSTSTMIYNIFVTGIQNRNLGAAAAQSIVLFVMVIALTVMQFRVVGRRVNYGA